MILEQVTVRTKSTQFKQTHHNRNGNYFGYWKLVPQLYQQARALSPYCSTSRKIVLWAVLLLKTPWWLFIKPLACLFSTSKEMQGLFEFKQYGENKPQYKFSHIKVNSTFRFLSMPYWFSRRRMLTKAEEQELIKDFAG